MCVFKQFCMLLIFLSGAVLSQGDYIDNHENVGLLPRTCGMIDEVRIVGGVQAGLYEFPWMALISHMGRNGIEFKCGGSIINKRYILTAAHCVKNKVIAGVRVGEYDISNKYDCQQNVCETHIQDIRVESLVIHENYSTFPSDKFSISPRYVNDIALLRLAEDIEFTYHRNVDSICLPITSELRLAILSNETATVAGWGLTEYSTMSTVLRKVDIPIHTPEHCNALWNRFANPGDPDITNDKLCAGSEDKDACTGDSGGPLMVQAKNNYIYRYVQYGIVTQGGLCGKEYPGLYTDVTKYMGWILDSIKP